MVFSSLSFIFVFLPLLLVLYFASLRFAPKLRNTVLLVGSLFFYAYGGVSFLLIMLVSIVINAFFGWLIGRTEAQRRRKLYMLLGVVLNLALLGVYKYLDFTIGNINALFGLELPLTGIVLPVGISFYTFQGMSYVLDVYNHTAEAQKNPLDLALYISLFPQLIAGPIVRYNTVAEEIRTRRENLEDLSAGIIRFCIGLGKKVLLANSVGALVAEVFALPPSESSVTVAWLGGIAYTLQIYFDFSGYSDMAIGLGRMFGFHFQENFVYPCVAQSITEYRRRWHVSLSQWFRDYVYIPLGGNRKGKARQMLNIFIVWMLTGLWHGAAWSYVCWGVYYAVLLILEKLFVGRLVERLWRPLRHAYAMILVVIGYVIFRSSTVSYATQMVGAMFGVTSGGFFDPMALHCLVQYKWALIAAVIASLPVKTWVENALDNAENQRAASFVRDYGSLVWAGVTLALSVMTLVSSSFNPFIYFQF